MHRPCTGTLLGHPAVGHLSAYIVLYKSLEDKCTHGSSTVYTCLSVYACECMSLNYRVRHLFWQDRFYGHRFLLIIFHTAESTTFVT